MPHKFATATDFEPLCVPDGGVFPTICTADECELIATISETGDRGEAYARLFASSTALLAALKGALAANNYEPTATEAGAAWSPEWVRAAWAAIAQAEG